MDNNESIQHNVFIDYHFHPNFNRKQNKKKAINKAHLWWSQFLTKNINTILVTEHSYKNFKFAFEVMKETKPDNCFCFPGVEYVTREGIDIILFSKNDTLYTHEFKSYELSYREITDFLKKNPDIYGFITHPYAKSKTGIIHNLGYSLFQDYVKEIRAIEIAGVSSLKKIVNLLNKINLLKFNVMNKYIDRQILDLESTMNFPDIDYHLNLLDFIAVGSDAHHFDEIGNCIKLKVNNPTDEIEVFNSIINSKNGSIHIEPIINFKTKKTLNSAFTALNEFKIKRKICLKQKCIDKFRENLDKSYKH